MTLTDTLRTLSDEELEAIVLMVGIERLNRHKEDIKKGESTVTYPFVISINMNRPKRESRYGKI